MDRCTQQVGIVVHPRRDVDGALATTRAWADTQGVALGQQAARVPHAPGVGGKCPEVAPVRAQAPRPETICPRREVEHAEEEGVRFEWLAAPKALLGGAGGVTGVRCARSRGRQRTWWAWNGGSA